jgi:hypothetical protein
LVFDLGELSVEEALFRLVLPAALFHVDVFGFAFNDEGLRFDLSGLANSVQFADHDEQASH